jgi:hypothetical protein
MSKIQWNKDARQKVTSIPVSVYLEAQRLGMPVSEYIATYGNRSQFNNVRTGTPNPKKQWGHNQKQKDQDK